MKLHKHKGKGPQCLECGEPKSHEGHLTKNDIREGYEYDWERHKDDPRNTYSALLMVLYLQSEDKTGAFMDLVNEFINRLDIDEIMNLEEKFSNQVPLEA